MRSLPRVLALVVSLFTLATSAAVFEQREFRSEVDERRYKALVEEIRCLVCQNQNIAASDADLAKDLRDRVYSMISDGRSDREIVDFMVERYGEFVLYRPPLSLTTAALWFGPFILAALGLVALIWHVRRSSAARLSDELSDAERARARALLDADEAQPKGP